MNIAAMRSTPIMTAINSRAIFLFIFVDPPLELFASLVCQPPLQIVARLAQRQCPIPHEVEKVPQGRMVGLEHRPPAHPSPHGIRVHIEPTSHRHPPVRRIAVIVVEHAGGVGQDIGWGLFHFGAPGNGIQWDGGLARMSALHHGPTQLHIGLGFFEYSSSSKRPIRTAPAAHTRTRLSFGAVSIGCQPAAASVTHAFGFMPRSPS